MTSETQMIISGEIGQWEHTIIIITITYLCCYLIHALLEGIN